MARGANAAERFTAQDVGGSSLRFNNTATAGFVTITDDSSFKTPMVTAFTSLMWVKLDKSFSDAGAANRFIAHGGASANVRFWELWGHNNDNLLRARICNNITNQTITGDNVVKTNEWILVGVTYSASTTFSIIHNDGLEGTTVPTVPLVDNGLDMWLASFNGAGSLLDCVIAYHVSIDQVMTAAQVSDFYYHGILPDGATKLIEHKFDEGQGTTLADSSPNSNTGTITGAGWLQELPNRKRQQALEFNNSLYFDGTNGDGLTSTDILDPASTNFTIHLWVKFEEKASVVGQTVNFIAQKSGAGSGRTLLYIDNADDKLKSLLGGSTLNLQFIPSMQRWYLFSLAYNNTSNTLKVYVDGLLIASETSVTAESADGVWVYARGRGSSNVLNGFITNIRLYTEEHSAETIRDYYSGVIPTANLRQEYLFSEGTGNSVADTSGNGYTITKVNGDWRNESVFKARTALTTPVPRFPYYEYSDLGVTSLWDWRTGYNGDNGNFVVDMIGGQDVDHQVTPTYTASEFSTTFNGSTQYAIAKDVPANESTPTAMSWFFWAKSVSGALDTVGFLGRWSGIAPGQRSWLCSSVTPTGDAVEIRLYLSSTGADSLWTRSTDELDLSTWRFVVITYDGATQTVKYYFDGVQNTTVVNGTPPTSLFASSKPIHQGAWFNASDVATGYYGGQLGVCGIAANKAFSDGEVTSLYGLSRAQMGV